MTGFLLMLAANIIDFAIVDQYFYCFTKERKRNNVFIILSLFASAFFLSIVNSIDHPLLNLICSILLIYLYGFNYKLLKWYYLILPVFYLGIAFVTEPVGILIQNGITGFLPEFSDIAVYFVSVLICELLRFLIVLMIKNFWNSQLTELPLKINLLLCSVPVLGILSCCIIIRTVRLYDTPEENLLCAGIIFSVLFSNILVLSLFKKMSAMFFEEHQNEMLIQEAKLKENYYQEVDKNSQQIRKIRHDLKNRLAGIYGIEGNEKLIRSKIKEILGELEESSQNLYTANSVLNSVLNIKYREADAKKIRVQSNILVPKYMNIDYGDMGVLFGNLLDNAIEACTHLSEDGRWMEVTVNYREHILAIRIRNAKAIKAQKKKDSLNHGIGLNSVKQIVDKYGGIAEFEDLGEIYESSAILYGIQNDKDMMLC